MEVIRNLPEETRHKYIADITKMIEEIRKEKDEDARQEYIADITKMIEEIRKEKDEEPLTEEEWKFLQDAIDADNENEQNRQFEEFLDDLLGEYQIPKKQKTGGKNTRVKKASARARKSHGKKKSNKKNRRKTKKQRR